MTELQTPTTAEELRGAGPLVTAARAALLETVRDGDHLGVDRSPPGCAIAWAASPPRSS